MGPASLLTSLGWMLLFSDVLMSSDDVLINKINNEVDHMNHIHHHKSKHHDTIHQHKHHENHSEDDGSSDQRGHHYNGNRTEDANISHHEHLDDANHSEYHIHKIEAAGDEENDIIDNHEHEHNDVDSHKHEYKNEEAHEHQHTNDKTHKNHNHRKHSSTGNTHSLENHHDGAHDHDHNHNHSTISKEHGNGHQHDEDEEDISVIIDIKSLGFKFSLGMISSTTWLASFSSILVISVVGLLTVGVIPLLKGPHQETALQLLVSLAVGTLVGDALIHLLPHALQTDHDDTSVVWKGFTATMIIVCFFVMDRVMEGMGHGHSHGLPPRGHDGPQGDSDSGSDVENLTVSTRSSRESTPVGKSKSINSLYSFYQKDQSYQSLTNESCCSMPTSSMMVIVGDAIHNFADGIAIGAAFSLSLAAGFSTSIAVLCHELPHEVGDFALLLHSGMSVKIAILYNCLSSVFAFIGLVVGLMLGAQGNFSSWLLSGTVGVFLYVALVSMLPELKGGDWKNSAFNTFGMVCGAVLLLFIGLYEHDLILLFEDGLEEHSH